MELITAEEKAQLERKLAKCYSNRKVITTRIAEARAMGDLSENAEYHAAREDAGLNEATIRHLEARLAVASVTDGVGVPDDMVFVGSTVKLRDIDTGDEDLYRLVGEASGNFDADYVEVTTNSPMGSALMKARIGDTVRVSLPRGEKRYEIVAIV
jgi:transcription elongation factor GreA